MNNNLFERNRRMAELGRHIKDIVTGKINLFSNDNNSNFFESAIANFVSKMENSLESAGSRKYKFNIESNKGLIKDILFIGAYVKKEYENIRNAHLSNNNIPNFDSLFSLRDYYLYDSSNATLKVNGNGLSSVNGTNMIWFKNQNVNNSNTFSLNDSNTYQLPHFKLFLQSLRVCKEIRNLRSHQEVDVAAFTLCSDSAEIGGKFMNLSIPLSYLSDFGKGIRANEKDTDIEEGVNLITNNIFFKLGYDLKEIPDFWYSVHPSRIKRLLEIFDYKDLEKLSGWWFSSDKSLIERVIQFAKTNGSGTYDYDFLKALSNVDYLCYNFENIIKLAKVSETGTYDYELLKLLPFEDYIDIKKLEETIKLAKISESNTYDYEILKVLLTNENYTKHELKSLEMLIQLVKIDDSNYDYELLNVLIKKGALITKERLEEIKSITKISGTDIYNYKLIEILNHPISNKVEITKLDEIVKISKIDETTYDYILLRRLLKLFSYNDNLFKEIINLVKTNDSKYDYKLLNVLISCDFSSYTIENLNEMITLSKINDIKYDYELLKILISEDYNKVKEIMKLVKTNETMDYELLKIIVPNDYDLVKEIVKLANISGMNTYDFELIKSLKKVYKFWDKKYLDKILELSKISGTDMYDYTLMEILASISNLNDIDKKRLDELKEMVKISETNTYDYEFLKFIMSRRGIFRYGKNFEEIKKLFKKNGTNTYDYELLKAIGEHAFNVDVKRLSQILEFVKKSETNTYDYELLKALPHFVFTCSDEIFNYIIGKVGIDKVKIKRLPLDIFRCTSIDMVKQILEDYGHIMMQSLFGIKNQKIVSLIVYMNALLTVYNPDQPTSMLNLEDLKIPFARFNNINQGVDISSNGFNVFNSSRRLLDKINNIASSSTNSSDYNEELISAVKAAVIEQLRNCSAHFHIFEVDGEPDKVRLKHEYNGAVKFNYVISINLLFEILENIRIAETKKRIIDKFDDANSEYELCNNNINTDQVVKLICDYGLTIEENDPFIEDLLTQCDVLEDDKENYKREILVALQNRQNQISLDSTLENVHVEDNVVSTLKK